MLVVVALYLSLFRSTSAVHASAVEGTFWNYCAAMVPSHTGICFLTSSLSLVEGDREVNRAPPPCTPPARESVP